jgi:phospholipase D-like protein/putative oligomerization/nucleic acid binding protein
MILPVATDYPFLDVVWSILIFMAFFLWIWLAITCFADIFRRRDESGWVKAIWIVFIIVLPYLGVLIYLIANHDGMAERNTKDVEQAQAAFDARVREVAGTRDPSAEIEKAHALLQSGAINQDEFERLKAKALAT